MERHGERPSTSIKKLRPRKSPTTDAIGIDWPSFKSTVVRSACVLTDGPGAMNYILADAILVRSARSFDVVSVAKTAGGGATAILEAP